MKQYNQKVHRKLNYYLHHSGNAPSAGHGGDEDPSERGGEDVGAGDEAGGGQQGAEGGQGEAEEERGCAGGQERGAGGGGGEA